MQRGKFIVLEGMDCTGKTTVADRLIQEFTEANQQWIRVRCPSDIAGTASAEIRKLVLHSDLHLTKDVQSMLFGAAIVDLIQSTIEPALDKGINVICERFTMSTRVYQRGSIAMSKIVECLEMKIQPDLTIVYDVTPTVYLERLTARGEIDRAETTDLEEINQRRLCYHELYHEYAKCVMIDATLPLEEVIEATRKSIKMV